MSEMSQPITYLEAPRVYGTSVRTPKAGEQIASKLRQQILKGIIRDGEELPPEAELMAQFEVSRPVMREALRILESQDLISVRRGARGGATAHQITGDLVTRHAGWLLEVRGATISDIVNAQLIFEPACARDLAFNRTELQLDTLRLSLLEERVLPVDQPGGRARGHLHATLIELAGNQTLILIYELTSRLLHSTPAIADPVKAAEYENLAAYQAEAHDDHARLVELIAARDGDAAEALWRAHIQRGAERLITHSHGDARILDIMSADDEATPGGA